MSDTWGPSMFLQLLPLPMGSQRDNWRKRGAPWGYPKVEEQLYRQALLSSCPLLPISYQEQNPHKGDKHRVNDPSTVPDICSGDTQRGTSLVNTGQATWSSDTLCPRTDRAFVGKEGLACRERSCCPRGTRSSRSPLLGCPSVAQVTLFPSPPSVPSGRHLLSPAGKGQHRLMLPQSSRHRGECVLGAAACYKYTSESENQRPPTRQPVCPAAPRSGVQALPGQPRAAYFPSQAHLTKAGWMGKKEINAPKFAVASLEGF